MEELANDVSADQGSLYVISKVGSQDSMALYFIALASDRSRILGNPGLSEHPTVETAIGRVQEGLGHLTRSHREVLIVVCTIHVPY